MKRRSVAATAAALSLIGTLFVAAPAVAAPDYPSWDDVESARQSESATAAEVERISVITAGLRSAAEDTRIASLLAGEAYQVALEQASQAEEKLVSLQERLATAKSDAEASARQVGSLLARMSRTGSIDVSAGLLLDSTNADDALYKLGALTKLTARSAHTLESAEQDANEVSSLTEQADVASAALEDARAAAETRLVEAEEAASVAGAAFAEQQANEQQLLEQLAYLKGTTAAVESAYLDGVAAQPAAPTTPTAPTPSTPAPGTPAPDAPAPAPGPVPAPPAPAPAPPAPPAPAPAPAPVSAAQSAVNFAYAQLGKWYQFAGTGPSTWDCSGLTMMAYRQAGVNIGAHTVGAQYRQMQAIGRLVHRSAGLVPGDLLYYSNGSTTNSQVMYHTTIYVGGGMMIEAPEPGRQVQVTPVRTRNLVPYVGRPAG